MAVDSFDVFLREACPPLGLEWRRYRRRAAKHRVAERMRELGLATWDAYLERLHEDAAEAAGLGDVMRVTISRFFRERERWRVLAGRVLPELGARLAPGEPLRAWSAGCCGGEEPYSLVLTWRTVRGDAPLDVLATDIDEASLARAAHGVYSEGNLREVPPELRATAFHRVSEGFQVDPALRAPVRFLHHNLLTDAPPEGMHLVICSYLAFTYFTGARRRAAAERLARSLVPGGALVIGSKEALGEAEADLFVPWPGAPTVHARRTDALQAGGGAGGPAYSPSLA
ncbi:MAG: chemotaxis protein CheR [Myxococcaceae bacterium]|nr:chemotaxis protein CheR [Myxococcaceae bacterium]